MTENDIKTLERLARAVEKAYQEPKRLMMRGFLLGIATGLGATVGVAVILAILGSIIRMFGGLPWLTDWLSAAEKLKY